MRWVRHKNGDNKDNDIANLEICDFNPLSREAWLERYGSPLPDGYTLATCAPVLGCTDTICHGWKVVWNGK